nr:MAG TPA: hypothetical protein [Bacteriophage sp.]
MFQFLTEHQCQIFFKPLPSHPFCIILWSVIPSKDNHLPFLAHIWYDIGYI